MATSASAFAPAPLLPPTEEFDRSRMAGADAALAYLQAKNLEALRLRTQSRAFAQQQMQHYLDRLGLDLSPLNVVHVAGSKGKGSTCAFAESILHAHGLRTGMYTSPHLISLTERYRIDTHHIDETLFLKHFWRVWDGLWATVPSAATSSTATSAATTATGSTTTPAIPAMPAYFAFLTLVGFDLFLSEHIDVLLLEVGLGGKLDATNVVAAPLATVITPLALEHTEILGNTLAAIAAEKAGIAKPGVPLFSAPQPAEALSVLLDAATAVGVPLHVVAPLGQGATAAPAPLPSLGLPGAHQAGNAALAVAASECALLRLAARRCAQGSAAQPLPPAAAAAAATAATRAGHADVPGVTIAVLTPPAAATAAAAAAAAAVAEAPAPTTDAPTPLFPPTGALRALTASAVTAPAAAAATAAATGSTAAPAALAPLFADGLTSAHWAGRCQTVRDPEQPNLTVYLDGAHTVESIRLCLDWFNATVATADAGATAAAAAAAAARGAGAPGMEMETEAKTPSAGSSSTASECMLLFNCGHVRNPFLLLEPFFAPSSDDASAAAAPAPAAPARFSGVFFAPFDHDRLHLSGPQPLAELAAACGRGALPAPTIAALAAADALPTVLATAADAAAPAAGATFAESGALNWQRTLMGAWDTVSAASASAAAVAADDATAAATAVPPVGLITPSGELLSPSASASATAESAAALAAGGGLYLSRPGGPVLRCVPSAAAALAQARAAAAARPDTQFRVLVTGSLYLVGNTLNALKVAV
jgi:folylpolyglutamate synthase/dihydropteroate synthase